MRANPKPAKPEWQFDGTTITVRIPMTFVRRGGRKVIIAPDGGHAMAPAKPRPDETLIRALARTHRWKRMLGEGICRSAGEIAKAEGIDRSFVNRLLRLTLLAPEIQEAILDGRQPKGMLLEELTGAMPREWKEQKRWVAGPARKNSLQQNNRLLISKGLMRLNEAEAGGDVPASEIPKEDLKTQIPSAAASSVSCTECAVPG